VKLKVPLLDLWLVTGRRLRAGYARRYEQGYHEGWCAGSAESVERDWGALDAAESRGGGKCSADSDRLAG
jgi:hypothetical protein